MRRLGQGQFRVHYQPIADLETKQITGFEALLRWQHPEQGLISPDKFVAAAEDSGLLAAAGQWLMQESCKQLNAWDRRDPRHGIREYERECFRPAIGRYGVRH